MKNSTILITILAVAGAIGAGFYFYSKRQRIAGVAPGAPVATALPPAAVPQQSNNPGNPILENLANTGAQAALGYFNAWLSSPSANTNTGAGSQVGVNPSTPYDNSGDIWGGESFA